jgi:hypothetical protein
VDINITGDIDTAGISVHYTIRELFSSLNVFENTFDEHIPLVEDLLTFFWLPLTSDLDGFIKKIVNPPLIINGLAGTLLYGFGDEPITIPDSGTLSIKTPMPATYRWETRLKNQAIRRGVFIADWEHQVLDLPVQRFYPTSIDIGLYQSRFPGFWVTRYLKSYGWFFSIGLDQQLFGLFLKNNQEPLATSFNSRPLIMPGLAGGYRFFVSKPRIPQPYAMGSVFFRYNYDKKKTDDFSPAGFTLSVGYDWETSIYVRFFADLGFSFYFLSNDYKDSLSKGTGDPGLLQPVLGGKIYLEIPSFRIGLKVPLPF